MGLTYKHDQFILRMPQERGVRVCTIAQPLGSRQVVRHVALDHAFGGSNPPSPAMSACQITCTVLLQAYMFSGTPFL
jgi:hypothetical protein